MKLPSPVDFSLEDYSIVTQLQNVEWWDMDKDTWSWMVYVGEELIASGEARTQWEATGEGWAAYKSWKESRENEGRLSEPGGEVEDE